MEETTALTVQQSALAIAQKPEIVAAAEREKAHIESAFKMALYKPRDIDQFRTNLLKNCKRPGFAALVEYSKPMGNTKVKGLSIRLADTALQLFGNIQCDTRIVYDDDHSRTLKVFVTDFETNVTKSADVDVKKTVERKNKSGREVISSRKNTNGEETYTVIATDDEVQTKQQSNVAKARRNLILELIPRDILDEARDAAREVLNNADAVDPDAAKKKLVDAFVVLGVQPKDIALYLGHPIDSIDKTEMADLRDIYSGIKNGECKWSDYTASEDPEDKPARKSPLESKKAKQNDAAPVSLASAIAAAIPKDSPVDVTEEDVRNWNANKSHSDADLIKDMAVIVKQIINIKLSAKD